MKYLRTSLVVLWLRFCYKLMKSFSQVNIGTLGNIFFGFVAKVYCSGVGRGKKMRLFYSLLGIHCEEKEEM